MTSSLRMQAVRATFFGLPAARSRWQKSRMTGLKRLATIAPMYRTARSRAHPPQICLLPRSVSLLRLDVGFPVVCFLNVPVR